MGTNVVLLAVVGLAVAGVVGYGVSLYNSLIQVRNNIDKAWNNIDVLLQQRHDELVKLVDACKGYMTHERGVLDEVVKARVAYGAASSSDQKTQAENQLNLLLPRVRAVWEAYPDLKASESFLYLQGRVSALESSISDRRELFNDSVNIYNINIQSFPERILAHFLAYNPHAFLAVPAEGKKDVKLDLGGAPAKPA